ncbi:MAG: hypothetical protein ACK4IS_13550 [Erythrobacter sp.]
MGRIRLPSRPNPSRIQAARVAATRVGQSSATQALADEFAEATAAIRADYDAAIADLDARLSEIEP